jgi:hypothetical protein
MPDRIQFRRVGEEWTAVYLNGNLARVGDSYLADEWLAEHYGVEIVDDTDSACMADNHNALPTLAQVEQAEQRIAADRAAADRLRADADALLAAARDLESRARHA